MTTLASWNSPVPPAWAFARPRATGPRDIFGLETSSREMDWAVGGAALGLVAALVELVVGRVARGGRRTDESRRRRMGEEVGRRRGDYGVVHKEKRLRRPGDSDGQTDNGELDLKGWRNDGRQRNINYLRKLVEAGKKRKLISKGYKGYKRKKLTNSGLEVQRKPQTGRSAHYKKRRKQAERRKGEGFSSSEKVDTTFVSRRLPGTSNTVSVGTRQLSKLTGSGVVKGEDKEKERYKTKDMYNRIMGLTSKNFGQLQKVYNPPINAYVSYT